MTRPLKILFTGRFYEHAPRGLTLRQGLQSLGAEVMTVRVDNVHRHFWNWRLKRLLQKFHDPVDVVVLADLSQEMMPAALDFARRRGVPVVHDFFFSMYEAFVFDRALVRQRSLKARRYHAADTFALRHADAVYFDTPEHMAYAENTFGGPFKNSFVIPIGCPSAFHQPVEPQPMGSAGAFNVLFWGSYIPLQGIEMILKAAHDLQKTDPDIRFFLIGKHGQTYGDMRQMAEVLSLQNVTFVDHIEHAQLMKHIAWADLALGIFGETGKASRVIPHKVYEAMSLGVPTLTAETPAFHSLLNDEVCCGVRPGQLAAKIRALKEDPERRMRLGQQGQAWARQHFTPEALGRKLLDKLQDVVQAK